MGTKNTTFTLSQNISTSTATSTATLTGRTVYGTAVSATESITQGEGPSSSLELSAVTSSVSSSDSEGTIQVSGIGMASPITITAGSNGYFNSSHTTTTTSVTFTGTVVSRQITVYIAGNTSTRPRTISFTATGNDIYGSGKTASCSITQSANIGPIVDEDGYVYFNEPSLLAESTNTGSLKMSLGNVYFYSGTTSSVNNATLIGSGATFIGSIPGSGNQTFIIDWDSLPYSKQKPFYLFAKAEFTFIKMGGFSLPDSVEIKFSWTTNGVESTTGYYTTTRSSYSLGDDSVTYTFGKSRLTSFTGTQDTTLSNITIQCSGTLG